MGANKVNEASTNDTDKQSVVTDVEPIEEIEPMADNAIARKQDNNVSIAIHGNKELEDITTQFEITKIQIQIAESMIDAVMGSSLKANFEVRDKDGNITVNRNDILTCIILGLELGLKPISALTYGRNLSGNGYISIKRGRELGLDDVAAMQNIHVWQGNGKLIVYTGVQIVTKVLIDAGVKMTVLEDAIPIYKYTDMKTSGKIYDTLGTNMIVVTNNTPAVELQTALKEGKIPVKSVKYDVRTTMKFDRPSKDQSITISYTLRQATNAGLYKGVDDDGLEVKGKANWNSHPETHLRGRVITIGGRIIVADKLNQVYSPDEASEITGSIIDTGYTNVD